jgi:hypothetical protein
MTFQIFVVCSNFSIEKFILKVQCIVVHFYLGCLHVTFQIFVVCSHFKRLNRKIPIENAMFEVNFYLGYQKQLWVGPAGSENA